MSMKAESSGKPTHLPGVEAPVTLTRGLGGMAHYDHQIYQSDRNSIPLPFIPGETIWSPTARLTRVSIYPIHPTPTPDGLQDKA